MHSSLKTSGVTSAARSRDSPAISPMTKSRPASPLRSAWRSRTAQPTLPAPSGSISSRSIAASTPLASAQRTEPAPSTLRNSAHAEYGTSAPRREATRVNVSDDAEAAAHRLRDLVEHVELAMGAGDVVEDVARLAGPGRRQRPVRRAHRRRAGAGTDGARRRFGHAFGDQRRHHRHEGADDARIEGAAGLVLQRGHRHRFGHGAAVRAIAGQGVVVVDDADDARAERDVLAGQAVGIAGAVPALVVRADQRHDRIRERHVRDDLGADARMRLDAGELLGGERPRLREDVLGHGQLADVVQQRRGLDAADLALAHAERLGQAAGQPLDAADVLREGVVLGVDRRGQGLDRRQVQVGDLAHLPLLVGEALEVDVIAAIGQQRRHRDREQQHDRR